LRLLGFVLTVFSMAMLSYIAPAHAQFEDLGGILEDILEDVKNPGQQTPIYGDQGIETVPVLVRYDQDIDFTNHILIVTAYPPNNPNGDKIKPQMLGQAHLRLDGLTQPLQVSVAISEHLTKNLTFSRITAEIIDENTNQIMISEHDGVYRGVEAPSLTLIKTNGPIKAQTQNDYIGIEEIYGEVDISDKKSLFRGGTLTIQLLENALAGGNSVTIASEYSKSVDNASPPYIFKMDRGISNEVSAPPLAFKAWITDWAGRKTHIMRKPVHYKGPDIAYKISLDSMAQGIDTRAGRNLNPTLMAQAIVSGEAIFDANKGLPSDARLKVILSRAVGAPGKNRTLASQTILLNGFSGKTRFALSTASTNFDPLIPAPLLSLQVIDRNDRVYFDSGEVRAKEGPQTIQLYPRSYY